MRRSGVRSSSAPPNRKARIISGPFFCLKSPCHAGFRLSVLGWPPAETPGIGHFLSQSRLFSLFHLRVRRRSHSAKIKYLRSPAHRQPRPPERPLDRSHYPCSISSIDDEGTNMVTREALYELAWSTPMIRVAEKFEVSGSYLARVCAELRVPRPERGY